jgi:multidrug efflux pump subunit AcrA (membrane-fusion protein)
MKLASMGSAASGTEEERAKAKLPPPPDEDSQLDVLLRPGLLADVEITVEKIPGAIHIPAQAVFEKDGKPLVYVKSGTRFEQRFVKLAKRSENTMVIAGGLKADEVVALADPTASPSGKKGEKKSGSSNAMPGMSSGGGAGKGGK